MTTSLSLDDFKEDLLQKLDGFRGTSRLCDVEIMAQGKRFPAHRAILAASCEVFNALLNFDMKEKQDGVIELDAFEPDIVELMLGFIYTGEIEINVGNALAVLVAADFLFIDKLKVAVDSFLSNNVQLLSIGAIETYRFASQYKCVKLKIAALKVLVINFEDVSSSAEFLELEIELLTEVISSEDLKVTCEEVVYRAVVDWITHKEERKYLFHQLFSHVRLCSFQDDFLENAVLQEPLVSTNLECLQLVLKSMKNKYIPTTANVQHPRACLDTYTNAILVFPVRSYSDLPRCPWCYIPSENKWCNLPVRNDSAEYQYGAPVYYNGTVILVKSCPKRGNPTSISIEQYDLKCNWWSCCATFDYELSYFSVACLKGVIYVIGGIREEKSVQTVFSCDITGAQEELTMNKGVASMKYSRSSPCVLSDEQYIYALGGISEDNGASRDVFSMEKYDPQTNQWQELICNPKFVWGSVAYGQCTLLNGNIYVVPKHDNSCNVYDTKSNTWSEISPPPSYNFRGALAGCEDSIYLIRVHKPMDRNGNYRDNCKSLKLITNKLDINTNAWSMSSSITLSSDFFKADRPVNYIMLDCITVRLPKRILRGLKQLIKQEE